MPQLSSGEVLKQLLDFVHELDPKKIQKISIDLENDIITIDRFSSSAQQIIGQDITIKIRLSA